ncbi:MAG: pyroglutamyl-peptidase I [Bdellovibrio sp.]|nr:pyroglutamyl-peptidase I [Bdellovibrio sp.]
MKILISGFKPFLGQKINPSQKIALDLQDQFADVISIVLPVEYKQSFWLLEREIQNVEPDFVIMIGQAAGRTNVCFEKIGLNWVQSRHADEAGVKPEFGAIEKAEPLALMTPFPVDQHFEKLKAKGLPVEISFSAGAYVCNDLYFRILNEFKTLKAVFIHVPLVPEQLDATNPNQMDPAYPNQTASLDYATQLKIITELVHSVRGN